MNWTTLPLLLLLGSLGCVSVARDDDDAADDDLLDDDDTADDDDATDDDDSTGGDPCALPPPAPIPGAAELGRCGDALVVVLLGGATVDGPRGRRRDLVRAGERARGDP